jgi:N6-L-threonylcarbamoyladenine synthase
MMVLGVETSCDETAVSLVRDGREVLADVVYTQEVHREFGGVVPELASRDHLKKIVPLTRQALARAGIGLNQIDAMAVTNRPGLAGALLVGFCFVRGLAWGLNKPVVTVNHVEAHVYGAFLSDPELKPPLVALVVSGGHTSLFYVDGNYRFFLLGRTLDDAAGEAYDKVAKLLELGYPGGPVIERTAAGASDSVRFPRAWLGEESLDFSFSGLKTAVLNHLLKNGDDYLSKLLPGQIRDICHGFQETVIDVLTEKLRRACQLTGCNKAAVVGGVAANGALKKRLEECQKKWGVKITVPPARLCTDNAAMVAACGYKLLMCGESSAEQTVKPRVIWPKYQST